MGALTLTLRAPLETARQSRQLRRRIEIRSALCLLRRRLDLPATLFEPQDLVVRVVRMEVDPGRSSSGSIPTVEGDEFDGAIVRP